MRDMIRLSCSNCSRNNYYTTKKGWKMNLPTSGERVVAEATVRAQNAELEARVAARTAERVKLVHHQRFAVVEQTANERALAVVHAAAGDEAQQALVLVLLQVGTDVGGDEI